MPSSPDTTTGRRRTAVFDPTQPLMADNDGGAVQTPEPLLPPLLPRAAPAYTLKPSLPAGPDGAPIGTNPPAATATAPGLAPRSPRQRLQDEYAQLSATPAEDRNGRLRSGLANALAEIAERANQVLASGCPVDEYGLAAIARSGAGGAVAGGYNPKVDEARRREVRMRTLEELIQSQLQIERADAQMVNDKRELDLRAQQIEQTGQTQREGILARSIPKPIQVGGKLIIFNRKQTAAADTPTSRPPVPARYPCTVESARSFHRAVSRRARTAPRSACRSPCSSLRTPRARRPNPPRRRKSVARR